MESKADMVTGGGKVVVSRISPSEVRTAADAANMCLDDFAGYGACVRARGHADVYSDRVEGAHRDVNGYGWVDSDRDPATDVQVAPFVWAQQSTTTKRLALDLASEFADDMVYDHTWAHVDTRVRWLRTVADYLGNFADTLEGK